MNFKPSSCTSCQAPIDSGMYYKTIDGVHKWHDTCFNCSLCSARLSPQSFYILGSMEIQCGPCCQSKTIKYCAECSRAIETTEASKVDGQFFHKSCLKCSLCGNQIKGDFGRKGKDVICFSCIEASSPFCAQCKRIILKEDFMISALNKNWHVDCFRCFVCGQQIEEEFVVHKQKLHHKECVDCD